jgi:hypothetical protein
LPLRHRHAGEIFIDLAPVGRAKRLSELFGFLADEVQDALVASIALGQVFAAFASCRATEEPIEHQAGIDLLGDRRGFTAPRKVGLISTTVTVVALAASLASLATDLQGREAGHTTDPLGGRLVDGDTGAEVGSVGLPRVAAGQKAGHGAGVVASAVAEGAGRVQGQAAQHAEVVLDRLERLEDCRQIESGSQRSRRPAWHVDAVGDVEESHAQGRALLVTRSAEQRSRPHGF